MQTTGCLSRSTIRQWRHSHCHVCRYDVSQCQSSRDDLASEFDRTAHPDRMAKLAQHLDLLWSVSEVCVVRRCVCMMPCGRQLASAAPVLRRQTAHPLGLTQRRKPSECSLCSGSGEVECQFCHGTGVMTVGDRLFCNNQGCHACPVCKGSGACKCEGCRGTGRIASWMSGRPSPPLAPL